VRIESYLRGKWGAGEALRHSKGTKVDERGRYIFAGSDAHLPLGANLMTGTVRSSGIGGGSGAGDPAAGLEPDPAVV
jgi:hypothetical protein